MIPDSLPVRVYLSTRAAVPSCVGRYIVSALCCTMLLEELRVRIPELRNEGELMEI